MPLSRDIHPLGRLYNKLDSKLDDRSVGKMKTVLRGRQVDIRAMQSFTTPADVFHFLEDKGTINENDLSFLKTLMTEIGRQPLVEDIEKCEEELRNSHKAVPTGRVGYVAMGVTTTTDELETFLQSKLDRHKGRVTLYNREIDYVGSEIFQGVGKPDLISGWARDRASKRKVEVWRHKTKEEAIKAAVKQLVGELRRMGYIV